MCSQIEFTPHLIIQVNLKPLFLLACFFLHTDETEAISIDVNKMRTGTLLNIRKQPTLEL